MVRDQEVAAQYRAAMGRRLLSYFRRRSRARGTGFIAPEPQQLHRAAQTDDDDLIAARLDDLIRCGRLLCSADSRAFAPAACPECGAGLLLCRRIFPRTETILYCPTCRNRAAEKSSRLRGAAARGGRRSRGVR
jgi:hypothetical protein